ncbi:hypothetical protein Tco_0393378 [Tanacetum coccineum]
MRIKPTKTRKEDTYQVVLDILKLSPCYNAFLLDNKKFKVSVKFFHEILNIFPKVPNKEFVAPPPHDVIVTFIKSLGYKGSLVYLSDLYTDHMYQPWRTFASIINKCLSGKSLVVIPKKARKGTKAPATPKKISSITVDEVIIPYPEEARKRPTGVVIRDTPNLGFFPPSSSSRSLSSNYGNQFLNLSSNASLVGIVKEPADTEINYMLDVQIQQEIPSVLSVPLLDVLVSVIPPHTTLITPIPTLLTTPLPTPPITSEALTITTTVPDLLPAVIQRLSNLEMKFKSWTKVDHSEAIEALVQANLINEAKNQLPKFLPKTVSDFVNLRLKRTVRNVLQKTPALLAQSSSTPGQSSSKATESLSEYELKNILFDKMDKSCSYMTHDKHQQLYNALLNSICLDDAIASDAVNTDQVQRKRDCGDDEDLTTGSD